MIKDYSKIPQAMRAFNNWVLFKIEERGGKKTKPPYQTDGRRAKANDPETWSTFAAVADVMKSQPGRYAGIGFQFDNSPFTGIDIDHCIDEQGNLSDLAKDVLAAAGSYAEYSPSGHGLHIIIKGKLKDRRGGKNASLGLEIYDGGRYFTMTGQALPGYEHITNNIEAVYKIYDKYHVGAGKQPQGREQTRPAPIPSPVADDSAAVIIERIRKSKQGALFSSLFDSGDTSRYSGDESAADMALMNILPFWCRGDAQKMEAIFSMSALASREKWQKRPDYRKRTIQKALKDWDGTTYDPMEQRQNAKQIEDIRKEQQINTAAADLVELAKFALTDTGNAERLKYIHHGNILYCIEAGRWLKWDGRRWHYCLSQDATELYNMVTGVMRLSAKQYIPLHGQPVNEKQEKAFKQYQNFFKKAENQNKLVDTIRRARAFFPVEAEKLDTHDWLLNCQNGTIDLQTGQLMKHDKKHLITQVCAAEYDPAARSELWEKTIRQIIPDNELRRWIQKAIGYSITGFTREEKFFCLYGEGGGGKGTFIETIARVLGDYASSIPIETILASRNDAGNGQGATPQLAKLAPKRFALTSESGKDRRFKDDTLKLLTGGDKLTARFLYGQPFEFIPHFKIWMSTNYKPSVADATDTGVKRRLLILPFVADLADIRDITLKERLLYPQERKGILKWAVDGCLMWQKEGLDDIPAAIKELMEAYYKENDPIGQFIDECCVPDEDLKVKAQDLLKAYNNWLEDNGSKYKIGRQAFSQDMQRRGYELKRFTAGRYFLGIGLAMDWNKF